MDRSGKVTGKRLVRVAVVFLIAVLICVVMLFRVRENTQIEAIASRNLFAMDTVMELSIYQMADKKTAAALLDDAAELIGSLDKSLSAHDENSPIFFLNEHGGGVLSGDAADCFLEGYGYSLPDENGDEIPFNCFLYPVSCLWAFDAKTHDTLPDDEDIAAALLVTDPKKVSVTKVADGVEVSFREEGMGVDLGGIAKGYASRELVKLFREKGVTSALLNLGGNVVTLGGKPDGHDFRIGVRDPAGGYFGVVQVSDMAVVTSGGYERYFELDGKRYHHIIDPATGHPSESGLLSATVVCADPVRADILSTALFVMGEEKATAYWRAHNEAFEMILLDEAHQITITEGLAGCFAAEEYPVQILTGNAN